MSALDRLPIKAAFQDRGVIPNFEATLNALSSNESFIRAENPEPSTIPGVEGRPRYQLGGTKFFVNMNALGGLKVDAVIVAALLLVNDGPTVELSALTLRLASVIKHLSEAELDLLIVIRGINGSSFYGTPTKEEYILRYYEEDRQRGLDVLFSAAKKGIITRCGNQLWSVVY